MKNVHGVVEVYCLHVWSLTTGKVAMTAHIVAADEVNHQILLSSMQRMLKDKFSLVHTTLQIENEDFVSDTCSVDSL